MNGFTEDDMRSALDGTFTLVREADCGFVVYKTLLVAKNYIPTHKPFGERGARKAA